ncbi:MAG: hypothetical protein PHD48_01585 [Alphaproteobacteria bacterium]|nr:hypothetical protein [Alphaproteobacteria bacterium]
MDTLQNTNESLRNGDLLVAGLLPSRAAGVSREHEGATEAVGATPSNRAPTNPILPVYKHGTDSLFLSFEGELHLEIQFALEDLKTLAQSDDETERCKAQLPILDHLFEVTDKGSRGFSYCLKDNAFLIKLSKKSKSKMPFASVQISSEYLSHVGLIAAYEELLAVLSCLGVISQEEKVSRADLHIDFSTDFDFSKITSNNVVCRSRKFVWYERIPIFTGFSIGLGGVVGFRLYDKTEELRLRPRPYLLDMWKAAGWDGKTKVWRAEFETKRPFLRRVGINTVDKLNQLSPVFWEFLTIAWLRIVQENTGDTHRERWTNYEVWNQLHKAFPADEPALSLQPFNFCREPSPDYVFKNGLAGITSFMALTGFEDPNEAVQTLLSAADDYHREISHGKSDLKSYMACKVEEKKKRYNKLTAGTEANAE